MEDKLERRIVSGIVRTLFFRDLRGGPWPIPSHVAHEPLEIPTAYGGRLAGTWFPHVDRPRGAVVLCHPHRRYARHFFVREGWVDFLHGAGFEVLAFDFPGYGGTPRGNTFYQEDVLAAAEFACWWAGGLPVHVAGVSLGAFAAANAAPRLDFVEGLVLESPYPSWQAWLGPGLASRITDLLERAFPHAYETQHADRNLGRAPIPRVLVAAAERDDVTAPALSRAVADAGPPGTRYLEVRGAGHFEAFPGSAAYRRAILETFGVPAAEAEGLAPFAALDRTSPVSVKRPGPSGLSHPAATQFV